MTADPKAPLANPTGGGSYIRNPDGSLVCQEGPMLDATEKPAAQTGETAVPVAADAGQKPGKPVKDA